MRALLAALAVAALAVPVPALAAQVPDPPPVDGPWLLTFTPTSVRTVGDSVGREGDMECGADTCGASYQFSEGATSGQQTQPLVRFDAAGCTALPCELRAVGSDGSGFSGPVTYDGTTYRATGKWFYASAPACAQYLPDGTDTLTFTVGGTRDEPTLSGQMTALYGYVGPTDRDGRCTGITGYEVYSGPVTGRPAFGFPGLAGGPRDSVSRIGDRLGSGTLTADERAAQDHTRPVLSTRVATARDLPWRPGAVLVSALLALLLVLLMPFPAALFNATLEANYDEVRGWFRLGGSRWPRPACSSRG